MMVKVELLNYQTVNQQNILKTTVVFEKDSKQVPATVWKPTNKLTKGKYSIELYTEGYLMGSSVIDLK